MLINMNSILEYMQKNKLISARGGCGKLINSETILVIKKLLAEGTLTQKQISKKTGLSEHSIWKINHGDYNHRLEDDVNE